MITNDNEVVFEASEQGCADYGAQHYNIVSMISQDLLDVLVCPVCRKPVVLNADGKSLKCGECRRVYPVQDDIPIMLVDAARIDA
ncbi:MAG: Trm112 family protein [Terriglobales bacterium]